MQENLELIAYILLEKKWLSPDDLKIVYGFSTSIQAKMRMASSSSMIPYHKIGKFVKYKREEIDLWIENHKIQ